MNLPSTFTENGDKLNSFFVHTLVESAATRHAGVVAVVMGEDTITYEELDKKASSLSNAILHHCANEPVIAISTRRSIDMVIGVLAILKSGKAYLPLDPTYPANRIQQIIQDSRIKWCLSKSEDRELFQLAGLSIIDPSQNYISGPGAKPAIGRPAYILYTSGSTGKPKGVCMGHSALVNLLQWQQTTSGAGVGTKTLQFAPLSFDVSFQEIFATLSTGGTLVLIQDEIRLDPLQLLAVIEEKAVRRLYLPFIALQYLAEMAVSFNIFPSSLREIITAGEQLKITPQLVAFFKALPGAVLCNQYGPTECHVVSELQLTGDPENWPPLPSIGKPIDAVEIFITDESLVPLPGGEVGELVIYGACLAEGYLYHPELTSQKFVDWIHPQKGPGKIYRTGDMARYLPGGDIEFLGRRDGQVKIRGNRIELGEIEVVLARHPDVKQAVVIAREDIPGQKFLVAYYISGTGPVSNASLKELLADALPDFMVPAHYVLMEAFPYTTSGKVDRLALPKPVFSRSEQLALYRRPVTQVERNIAQVWSSILAVDQVGLDDNFFELGGNSLLAQKTVTVLKADFDYTVPITKLYQYPTVSGIATLLLQRGKVVPAQSAKSRKEHRLSQDVAVVGMAGRFPGAASIEQLWEILQEGRETIQFFTKEELDITIPAEIKNDPDYTMARGIIENADRFDAAFFDLNPKLAELMDPQQRVFLEIAWEVLEKTGHLPQTYKGSVGVFAGTGNNSYYYHNVQSNTNLINQQGNFQVMTVNEKDYVASRTAYQLNLKGPAVSVYSGCSTSLLAIATAVESIRNGQADVAVAGGASITSPIKSGHIYQEGAMLSRDGHCRSFDANSSGTVFSDGAAVVLLKSLEAAKNDGDTIYAVIKGVGVNNDGGGKGSFTAPSSEGQAHAIAMAMQDAGVDPATISYVETHGTATPLGDPIEIEGLSMAFGDQPRQQYCAIGSIKSNMGHLTAAAGAAGLIKTVLALHHCQIPPSLGFETPNPNIDFEHSPFYVNTKLTPWTADNRRAGVSSFGVGGTNVHVVLESFANEKRVTEPGRPVQLFTYAAKTRESLDQYAHSLSGYLGKTTSVNLADVAYTLNTTRVAFKHRRFLLASSAEELIGQLMKDPATGQEKQIKEIPAEIAFMFPGQGSQYLNMGIELYQNEAVYRLAVDECAEILLPLLETDIRDVLFPQAGDEAAAATLKNTRYTQPAIFVTSYSLGKLWMSWGITPSVLCGHSIGEFVAACFGGVFSLPDALHIIASRGKMVSELPSGTMLSVRMPAVEIAAILPAELSIAAINSNKLCVVAGETPAVTAFARLLDERSIPNKILSTSHAFHSSMMEPIIGDFEKIVASVKLNHPRKAIVSTVTGTWLTDAQATDPAYWSKHLRSTVLFATASETIVQQGKVLLLEVGPGNALTTLVKQQHGNAIVEMVTSLEQSNGKRSEYEVILKAAGQLWLNGVALDWESFYKDQQRVKINLPTYSFDRKYCWVSPAAQKIVTTESQLVAVNQTQPAPVLISNMVITNHTVMRKDNLVNKIKEILEDASGIDTTDLVPSNSFLEIGLDSLLLTQVALTLKKEFKLPLTFRQLNEELATPELLAVYLDENLPAGQYEAETPVATVLQAAAVNGYASNIPLQTTGDTGIDLIAQQLQILAKQVALLQGNKPVQYIPAPAPKTNSPVEKTASVSGDLSPEEAIEIKKPFGATARIDRQVTELSEKQKNFLANLTEKYNLKTKSSKIYAQTHRAYMSDPRVVSGFKPLTKEIVYPIVVNKSAGSKLWDIDGNEYIDVLNGFGSSLLGYQPDFIKKALYEQIESGYEVGPQHDLAGEVSKMICELTGFDRAALCSTGSEAVLGTMRIARTVTGRSLIVAFTGSYHGIVDEVIVRGTKKLKSYPAAPGIMPEAVQNMLILDYGTDESLKIIRERAHELAAVLVEPIQSRRPEFRPVEFLREVREITSNSGTALIFDEVITGFRMHPRGAQGLFDIQADLSSYGKVVGGGLPIGVIAGKKEMMDALDGGFWQYGDNSYPEAGVTYFAGTFVRHPLALAAAKVSLRYMIDKGPDLQRALNAKGDKIAESLNVEFEKRNLPFFIAQFGSLWKIKFKEEVPYGELLFTLMRLKGIHVWDGFPCFMTEAITNEEIEKVIQLFIESADEMIQAGFFPSAQFNITGEGDSAFIHPPVEGAKLGRDQDGNPAWFISDKRRPGKYLRVEINSQ